MKFKVNIKNLDTRRAARLCDDVSQVLSVKPDINRVHISELDYTLMRKSVDYRVRTRLKDKSHRVEFVGFHFDGLELPCVES